MQTFIGGCGEWKTARKRVCSVIIGYGTLKKCLMAGMWLAHSVLLLSTTLCPTCRQTQDADSYVHFRKKTRRKEKAGGWIEGFTLLWLDRKFLNGPSGDVETEICKIVLLTGCLRGWEDWNTSRARATYFRRCCSGLMHNKWARVLTFQCAYTSCSLSGDQYERGG